jgi:DNA-binding CsgD family transcriptional regulator
VSRRTSGGTPPPLTSGGRWAPPGIFAIGAILAGLAIVTMIAVNGDLFLLIGAVLATAPQVMRRAYPRLAIGLVLSGALVTMLLPPQPGVWMVPCVAPTVTRRLIAEFIRRHRAPADNPLTPRETEVLCLIARGLSNAEIASALIVTEHTVKNHVARVLTKLGLRDRTQAVIHAYETGLVTAGDLHGSPG